MPISSASAPAACFARQTPTSLVVASAFRFKPAQALGSVELAAATAL
jgi:hypothetical protein